MSPKSRGRSAGRGRKGKNKPPAAVREIRLSDRLLRDARRIVGNVRGLDVERWASRWFGRAWLAAAKLARKRPSPLARGQRLIMDTFRIGQFDPEWSRQEVIERNPLAWLIQVDGLLMDARKLPREIQVEAFELGLIPYVPA
ncbi:MAG: hypothetical protein GEU86_21015 [Actinophytocola sp.]|nr:hypothetical protein [Actinophytocola sp.]